MYAVEAELIEKNGGFGEKSVGLHRLSEGCPARWYY